MHYNFYALIYTVTWFCIMESQLFSFRPVYICNAAGRSRPLVFRLTLFCIDILLWDNIIFIFLIILDLSVIYDEAEKLQSQAQQCVCDFDELRGKHAGFLLSIISGLLTRRQYVFSWLFIVVRNKRTALLTCKNDISSHFFFFILWL